MKHRLHSLNSNFNYQFQIFAKILQMVVDVIVLQECISTKPLVNIALKTEHAVNGVHVRNYAKSYQNVNTNAIAMMITYCNPTDLHAKLRIHPNPWPFTVQETSLD